MMMSMLHSRRLQKGAYKGVASAFPRLGSLDAIISVGVAFSGVALGLKD